MCKRLSFQVFLWAALTMVTTAAEPVGHWSFDGHLDDVAGSANAAFFGGAPSYVKGRLNQAIMFDGADDYAEVMVANLDAYTISAWVMPERTDAASLVVRTSASGTTTHWSHQMRITTAGVFEHYLWDGSARTVQGTTPIEAGSWHFVAISAANNGPVQLYVDGQEEGAANTVGAMWSGGDRFHIGSNSGNGMGWFQGIIDDVRIFGEVLPQEEIERVMKSNLQASSEPVPDDTATDVPRDVLLSWLPGESAATHDVYFGDVFDDVNDASRADPGDVPVSQGQTDAVYVPPAVLEFGRTYYWRVDEVNAAPDNTIFKGAVWSFTVEPFAYPIRNIVATSNGASEAGVGPERTVDGSGVNADDQHSTEAADMWLAIPGAEALQLQYDLGAVYKLHEMLVWNYNVQFELMLGFGLKDVTVEYSADGDNWTVLGDVTLAQATARADYTANSAVAFNGVPVQHVRLAVNSGYGPMGQFGLSEVRFLFVPAQAREPQPADGDTNALVGTALNWRAGREAVTHDVYLGTDAEALALVDSVTEATLAPGDLQFGSTYYWQVDEVNETDAVTVWPGPLWTFATQEYAVIDDMESYDDEENRIFDTWIDGFINETGSTVGYFDAPFAEKTVVNSGGQSMPLEYDNSGAPFYSEAELDLGSLNLTGNGADTLRLFVAGQAPGFSEAADGTILMNGIGADIWGNADQFRYAYKRLTGDGSMIARVDALDGTPNAWAKAGVMIRQDDAVGSKHAFMAITGGDGGGAAYQRRIDENGTSTSDHPLPDGPFAPPYWVRVDRAGTAFTAYISADGDTWVQAGDTQTIEMDAAVLIGLALTSHNAGVATSAEFSNVSFTGNVAAAWEMAEIGVAQPEGNIPESIYVALEDANGNVAVVTSEAGATARSGWTEWLIPYSDLAGVNLSRAAVLYIGIGDRDNPAAGGAGLIFVDDVGFGRPAAE